MREFAAISDLLCLDFANSVQKIKESSTDFVADFPGLLQFLLEVGVLTPASQRMIEENWGSFEQKQAVARAHSFRTTLRNLANALVHQNKIDSVPSEINEVLSSGSGYSSVTKSPTGFQLKYTRDFTLPEHLLVAIAESAAWLLCKGDWNLVKVCSNPECGLFFYDTTRNHKRRWCSMQTCGNRSKVDAYLKRKHSGSDQE